MKKWASKVKRTLKEEGKGRRKRINLAIVSANNHYAGFGPGTANMFRNMLGLSEAKWEDRGKEDLQEASHQDEPDVKQSTLSDFLD